MTDMEHYLNSLDHKMVEHARLARTLVAEIEATEQDSDPDFAAMHTQAARLSDELRRCQWDVHLELVHAELSRTQLLAGR